MMRAVALIAALLSPNVASAHDVWLSLTGDAAHRRVIVNYGHPDDRPPAFADKVLDLAAIDADTTTSLRAGLAAATENGIGVAASKPFADNGHLLLAARYDNGLWSKMPDGEVRNVTRRLLPDAAETVWSGKFAKALSGPGAPYARVLRHDLELVPLSDPALAKPGDILKLRVLFRGLPLADAVVERGDAVTPVPEKDIPRFATDAAGVALVPIVKPGPLLLVVDHRVAPSLTPAQADADLYNATLWVVIGV